MNFNQLDFAVYCIGLVASKLNMSQTDIYDRLKKSGILGGLLSRATMLFIPSAAITLLMISLII